MKKNNLRENAIWGISAKCIAMLFYMLTDIVIARSIDENVYGEWAFFFSIASVAFIISRFGINGAIQPFVAGEYDEEKQGEVIKSGSLLRLIMSMVCSVIIGLLLLLFANKFGYPDKYPELKKLFMILPILVFFNSFVDYYKNVSAARLDIKKQFVITVIEYLSMFLFCFGILSISHRIEIIMLSYTCAYIISAFAGVILYKNSLSATIIYEDIKKIFLYAITILATNVISELLMEMDTFMLGMLVSTAEVGKYSIAKSLINKGTNFSLAFASSTMAAFAILERKEIAVKRKTFKRLCLVNLLVLAMGSLVLVMFNRFIIMFLYGEKYIESAYTMLVLIPYLIMFSMSLFPAMFLGYRKLAKRALMFNIVMLITNFVLNSILIPKYGSAGAAIATDIAIFPYMLLLFGDVYLEFKKIEIDSSS